MTGEGTFEAVVREVAAGATPTTAGRRLGLAPGLAEAIVDEAARLGLLAPYGSACGACPGAGSTRCGGCPMTISRGEA